MYIFAHSVEYLLCSSVLCLSKEEPVNGLTNREGEGQREPSVG